MAWSLKGQLVEACTCNMFCPCWFAVQDLMVMDKGWCAGLIAVRVQEGSSDGVSLAGRTATVALYFPGPTLFDGAATARVFVDSGASADQQRELEAIFQGARGGPMSNLAPLIASWLPTKTAKIGVSEKGDSLTISVEGVGELHSTQLRDPEGNGFSMTGGGFIGGMGMPSIDLAPTRATKWIDGEMPATFETASGARGACTWSG